MEPKLIAADDLCALTRLSDRRHRQIQKEGYFPPPVEGKYEFEATVRGLFTYYQESKAPSKLKQEQHALTKARRETAEEELAILRGEYVRTALIGPALLNCSMQQRSVLQRKLEGELAPKLAGKSYPEIRALICSVVEEVCGIFREEIKKWMQSPPKNS